MMHNNYNRIERAHLRNRRQEANTAFTVYILIFIMKADGRLTAIAIFGGRSLAVPILDFSAQASSSIYEQQRLSSGSSAHDAFGHRIVAVITAQPHGTIETLTHEATCLSKRQIQNVLTTITSEPKWQPEP